MTKAILTYEMTKLKPLTLRSDNLEAVKAAIIRLGSMGGSSNKVRLQEVMWDNKPGINGKRTNRKYNWGPICPRGRGNSYNYFNIWKYLVSSGVITIDPVKRGREARVILTNKGWALFNNSSQLESLSNRVN